MMGYFQLHEHLSQYPGPLAEKVHIPRKLGLAQQIRECHPEIVGHRCVFSFRVFGETTKNENHTMADVVNGLLLDLHTHGDSNLPNPETHSLTRIHFGAICTREIPPEAARTAKTT
jgi:hypothetical protein